jgi:hypothetical protein
MIAFLRSQGFNIVAATLLTLAIWMLAAERTSVTESFSGRVQVQVPAGADVYLAKGTAKETVEVRVNGSRSAVDRARRSLAAGIALDVVPTNAGDYEVDVAQALQAASQPMRDLAILSVEPASMRLTLGTIVTVKAGIALPLRQHLRITLGRDAEQHHAPEARAGKQSLRGPGAERLQSGRAMQQACGLDQQLQPPSGERLELRPTSVSGIDVGSRLLQSSQRIAHGRMVLAVELRLRDPLIERRLGALERLDRCLVTAHATKCCPLPSMSTSCLPHSPNLQSSSNCR